MAAKRIFINSWCSCSHIESKLCYGVYDAVSHFNYGKKAALDTIRLLDIDPGIYMTKSCGSINKKRKHQSIYKTLSPQKKRRKILRHSSKKRNDKVVEQEGTSYEAGGFETFVLCLNCYIYIVGTHSGGGKFFARKVGGKSEREGGGEGLV